MARDAFKKVAVQPENARWERLIERETPLYSRKDEIRSPFARDYTRILHSNAYRRLKHKTQVFFNVDNDHICTRMEHVAHVESVADTVARYLGLNGELTKAIAFGHDLGHAPFGHHGEKILSEISRRHLGIPFWHERNGLRFVDDVELLADDNNIRRNLNLTYAVRDGIISHCGEVDQNGLIPREQLIDLDTFVSAGQFQPATWEGCVVKLADKIAYIGRDIEDATSLNFIDREGMRILRELASEGAENRDCEAVNTTVIMHGLINDVCRNSSPENGIRMSASAAERLSRIKAFNTEYIYRNKRFEAFQKYAALIIETLFTRLYDLYDGRDTLLRLQEEERVAPELFSSFVGWLVKYCLPEAVPARLRDEAAHDCNKKIYGALEDRKLYAQAIVDFISGMTDAFAVKLFEEQLSYRTYRG